jgi:hypothetical protein
MSVCPVSLGPDALRLSEIQNVVSNATTKAREDACTNLEWRADVKNRL